MAKRESKNNKKRIIIAMVLIIAFIIIGVSYAYWIIIRTQEEENVLTTGCFDVEFVEGNAITIANAFPVTDSEGLKGSPYTFTIKNICSTPVTYQINLEILDSTTLESQYVKGALNISGARKISDMVTVEETITGATSHKMIEGFLSEDESVTYDLRLWMDTDTPMEEGMNKKFNSKIVIINSPAKFYDVRQAGVMCDGVTDDTAAINAVLNSEKTHIQFPEDAECKIIGLLNFTTDSKYIHGNGSTIIIDDDFVGKNEFAINIRGNNIAWDNLNVESRHESVFQNWGWITGDKGYKTQVVVRGTKSNTIYNVTIKNSTFNFPSETIYYNSWNNLDLWGNWENITVTNNNFIIDDGSNEGSNVAIRDI